jgi:hypothetical protein
MQKEKAGRGRKLPAMQEHRRMNGGCDEMFRHTNQRVPPPNLFGGVFCVEKELSISQKPALAWQDIVLPIAAAWNGPFTF